MREVLERGGRLILDGGFGTMVQTLNSKENLWQRLRPAHFADTGGRELTGLNDSLCLMRPDIVADIHRAYLEAGADIITTNTFNAQRVSLADYGCEHLAADINKAAARIAREVADKFTEATGQRRYVAGSVGPTNKTLSISPDVEDPAARSLSFDELEEAYHEQVAALLEGGVDAILIETVFDTLNAKAALKATMRAQEEAGGKVTPVMLSATVSDRSERTLSGQTIEAFVASVSHACRLRREAGGEDERLLLSIGLNCGFGAEQMRPTLRLMSQHMPEGVFLSVYPNAGLPNANGEYDETPEQLAANVAVLIDECQPNIIGGCCGTTPEHIRALRSTVDNIDKSTAANALKCFDKKNEKQNTKGLTLAGLDALPYSQHTFVTVGERCNVAGSRKFLRLIKEKNYSEAVSIAREQVAKGAMVIDVNLDDALLDARTEMRHFLNLLASEPEAARAPIMIDSSDFSVIVEGLKCLQGKGIVNSLSLKEGEETLIERARICHSLGAAIVVMLFDERGQATDYERRIEIAQRAYNILTKKAGIPESDIIFDPNVLAVATGIREHDAYAADFIRAVGWMRQNLPGVQISGGISNLSFAFRGNNYLREAMHAVFLHHARKAGMNMAIVNAATRMEYDEIPDSLRETIEDVILNRRQDACERLTEEAKRMLTDAQKTAVQTQAKQTSDAQVSASQIGGSKAPLTVGERLIKSLIDGEGKGLEADIQEALTTYPTATEIIDGPLMEGMRRVGDLFGQGRMFLPQVVKTARTMKQAVALLRPHIEAQTENTSAEKQPHVLIATVKGDVHDIGKNIVGVVMQCGGFRVTDLGVMVEAETIVNEAMRLKPDIIALSGLITPSLNEMTNVVARLKEAGIKTPVLIGGATTSDTHTALRIATAYDGPVAHVGDASQNVPVANSLLATESREESIADLSRRQQKLREEYERQHATRSLTPIEEARRNKPDLFREDGREKI